VEPDRFGLFGGVGLNGLRVLRPRDLRAAEKVTFSKERCTSSFVHKEAIELSGNLGERKPINRNVDFAPKSE
jgi:hypothetical protein